MMNILIFTQFFNPTGGGGEVMFYQIAKQLGKKGHKVFVIKHKSSGLSWDRVQDLPLNVVVIEVNPPVIHRGGLPAGIVQNMLYILNSFRIGLKIVKNNYIDIIHCNTYSPLFVGWFLCKLTSIPLVVTIHDVASLHGYSFWKKWMEQFGRLSWLKALIAYIAELLVIKLSKNIHVVSETTKKDILLFNSKCNVLVIPNSLDLEHYKFGKDISYDGFILFIGRLVFYKHLEVVIEALKLLKNRCDVRLVVLGDGPMRSKWEELVDKLNLKDMVEFKGYVSHREKLYYLSRCRALVLPSIFEGFGMVILEAWALKKPVIVANVEPQNKIVTHGLDGYVVENKPEIWAKYIHLLIADEELCRQMGNNGYWKLMTQYNIDKQIDELEKLYMKLATERYRFVA
jgi:glycosyltransferase involved in cell wall biosynthesis